MSEETFFDLFMSSVLWDEEDEDEWFDEDDDDDWLWDDYDE